MPIPDRAKSLSPVLHLATAVLEELRFEDATLADSLKDVLPSYALEQERKGNHLTQPQLMADARKGVSWFKAQRSVRLSKNGEISQTPLEIYQETIRKFDTSLVGKFLHACRQGDLPQVMVCLSHGVGVGGGNCRGVVEAAAHGQLPVVKYLHQQKLAISAQVFFEAYDEAAINGHLPVVRYLSQYASPWAGNISRTLMKVAANGHLPLVEYMHQNRADFIMRANRYEAILRAAENGHLPLVKNLCQLLKKSGVTIQHARPLCAAAKNGHLPVVKYLHQHGADITHCDNEALGEAASHGHLPVVQYLHEQGADITARNNYAFITAARFGKLPVVQYVHQHLRQQGVDLTAENNRALKETFLGMHLPIVRYLCDNGADVSLLTPHQQELLNDYTKGRDLWQKTVRMAPPDGLHDSNPRFFRKAAYEFLLPLLAHEGYSGIEQHKMAFNAAGLFQSPARVIQYLAQWGAQGKQPLHDLIFMIDLPQEGAPNIKDWGDAVLKCGPSMAKLVKFSDQVPSPAKSTDGRSWSYNATRAQCAQFSYKRGAEHPGLAELCFAYDVKEKDFEKALNIVQSGATPNKNLPPLFVEGESFDLAGGKFYQLPPHDMHGLFLGEITDCCQSIGGYGHDCAKYGYQSENGGFYVVENAKGEIISQTFAWRSKEGGMCFDTLETLGDQMANSQWQKLLREVAAELTNRKDHDLTRLTVGMGGDTPRALRESFARATQPDTPLDYKGYSEAQKQITIWERAPEKLHSQHGLQNGG